VTTLRAGCQRNRSSTSRVSETSGLTVGPVELVVCWGPFSCVSVWSARDKCTLTYIVDRVSESIPNCLYSLIDVKILTFSFYVMCRRTMWLTCTKLHGVTSHMIVFTLTAMVTSNLTLNPDTSCNQTLH
jgi:hypothetical protein